MFGYEGTLTLFKPVGDGDLPEPQLLRRVTKCHGLEHQARVVGRVVGYEPCPQRQEELKSD